MRLVRRRGWEIAEHLVTPEAARLGGPKPGGPSLSGPRLGRRSLLAGAMALSAAGATAATPTSATPTSAAPASPRYQPGRAVTAEHDATTYNNYYEFSESKNLWRAAQALKQRPWTIRLDGLVAKPRTLDLDDLLRQVGLEERIYRHRCVETWAMTVPWTGFPLRQLVTLAEPLGSARFVVFETIQDPSMRNLSSFLYTWPYVEAVTIDEAANDLAFLATGLYGKPLPPQNGGPLRLALPWKYGFKSAKAIVTVRFTDQRPTTFWEALAPGEYGFWANVNPAVPHPRWSQATETLLGTSERVPTQIFNGYGEFVASLYSERKSEKLFM